MTDPGSPPARPETTGHDGSSGSQAQQMAEQAQEKAQDAIGNARNTVREQLDQRSHEAGEKIVGTAGDLRSVGQELRNQGKETPAKFADMAAERTEKIGSYLSGSNVDKLLEDVEDFGRRQPMAALAGGVAIGFVAARFLKASSRDRYQSRLRSEGPTRELSSVPRAPAGAPAASSGGAIPPQRPMTPDPAFR